MESALKFKAAVCTKSGILVDQHFGHADQLIIYEYNAGRILKADIRPVRQYCKGADDCDVKERMQSILEALAGCACVICKRIGPEPAEYLRSKGIQIFEACDTVEQAVAEAARLYQG